MGRSFKDEYKKFKADNEKEASTSSNTTGRSFKEEYNSFKSGGQTQTAEPKSTGSTLTQRIQASRGTGNIQTQTAKADTTDRKARAQAVIEESNSRLKANMDSIKTRREEQAQAAAGRNTVDRQYKTYQKKISSLENKIDAQERQGRNPVDLKNELKAVESDYTKYKTMRYKQKQNYELRNIYSGAEKDPNFSAYAEKGKKLYDDMQNAYRNREFSTHRQMEADVNAAPVMKQQKNEAYTDEERNTYYYLLGKNGWDSADAYEKLMERELNRRMAEQDYELMRKEANENKIAGVGMNTVGSLMGGAGLAESIYQGVANSRRPDEEYVPADPYRPAFAGTRMQKAATEGVTQDIQSPLGKFLAETGLSAVNFLTGLTAGGGAATLALMGSNAGGSAAYEAMERGATAEQAAKVGIVAAIAEAAFERIPVGHASDLFTGNLKESLAKAIITQGAEEGFEELATDYVNLAGDNIIMGSKSEMNQYIRELMKQGLSEEEARKKATLEFAVVKPAMSALGGFVSGAGIGAAGSAGGQLQYDRMINDIAEVVAEEQGITKEEALPKVREAFDRVRNGETGETEVQAEPAQEAQTMADIDEETKNELVKAVQEDSGMSDEEARAAVEEAITQSGENLTETGEPEPERIWERAAREQAEYDRQWEEAHAGQEENFANAEENISTEPDTKEMLQNYEDYEDARQAQIREDALIRKAVLGFTSKYGRFKGYQDAFETWVRNDLAKNGINGVYDNDSAAGFDYNSYVSDMLSDFDNEVSEEYAQAKGQTVEQKTGNALKAVLQRDGRTPVFGGQFTSQQETAQAERQASPAEDTSLEVGNERYYGANAFKDRADAPELIALGQEKAKAKRFYDRAIAQRHLTDDDLNVLRSVVSQTKQIWTSDAAEDPVGVAVDYGMQMLRDMERKYLTDTSRILDENLLRNAIEYNKISNELKQKGSGELKAAAVDLAHDAVETQNLFSSAKDKKAGIWYSRETFQRNIEDILKVSPKAAAYITEKYYEPIRIHTAQYNNFLNHIRKGMKELNIDTGKRKLFKVAFDVTPSQVFDGYLNEDGIVQAYGEGLIDDRTLESLKDKKGNRIDAEKIRSAKNWISAEYKKIIDSANLILMEYGYDPIGERQNYFPHYTEEEFSGLAGIFSKIGIDLSENSLPTSIAGLTENFKPGKQWFGNFMQRTGAMTDYGAIRGMDRYIETVGHILYHTADVQRLRALSNEIRYKYAPETLRAQMDEEMRDVYRGDKDIEDAQNRISELQRDIEISKLPNFVNWLDEYTNLLAGKKTRLDRDMEQQFSRKAYSIMKSMNKRMASNMVGFNMSTPFTNFIPWTQADISVKNKMKGAYDTIQNALNNDGLMNESVMYTNRIGSDRLIKTKLENYMDKSGYLMNLVDAFTVEGLIRGRYYDNIEKGMNHEEALAEADDHVARVVADRSTGAVPTLLQARNPLMSILTMFQTEVNNQYSYMFKDLPRQKGTAKALAALAKVFFGAFIYNELYEKFIGRRPTFDPIDIMTTAIDNFSGRERNNLIDVAFGDKALYEDNDISTYNALAATGKDIAEEIPFIGGLLGGGRVPISSGLPSIPKIVENQIKMNEGEIAPESGRQEIWKEARKPLYFMVPPGGGSQAKKTIEGISEMAEGGSFTYDKEGNRNIRYLIENPTAEDYIKNAMFGRTASEEYRQWKANGFKNLTAKQTEAYYKVVDAGVSYDKYLDVLYAMKGKTKKADKAKAIYDMEGLSKKQKDTLWESITDYKGDVPDFGQNRTTFYKIWGGDE